MRAERMRICVPLLLLALTGCATLGHTAGSEEFFIRGEGGFPLRLFFRRGFLIRRTPTSRR
jgi:hypothetical protein